MSDADPRTRAAVEEHVAAFNAWDGPRLLAGFAPDATWVTGQDRYVGTTALAGVFDPWLWTRTPHLEVRTLVVQGGSAALEVVETVTVNGVPQVFAVAAFFDVDGAGRITRGTVYREGHADI